MQYKKIVEYLIKYGLMDVLKSTRDNFLKLFKGLKQYRINRMLDKEISFEETKITTYAEKINELSIDEVALVEHEHNEYYKKDDIVEEAYSIEVNGQFVEPSGLALAEHKHETEYVKPGEVYIATNKLGGKTANEFAMANHEHEEYLRKDEIPVAADTLNNLTYDSFASIYHDHSEEYYSFDDTVENADYVFSVDNYELFSAEDFAKINHEHSNYFTLEQAKNIFKTISEPYYYTKAFNVDVYNIDYTSADIVVDETNSAYDLLQAPFTELGFKPEAKVVNANLVKEKTAKAILYNAGEFAVNVGDYFTIELTEPKIKSILGVFPSFTAIPATDKAPNQMPVFIGWSGKTIIIYGLNFWGIPRQTITGKLLIVAELEGNPSDLPDCEIEPIQYAPIYLGAHKYLCPYKKKVKIPLKYSAFPEITKNIKITITNPNNETQTIEKAINQEVEVTCEIEGVYTVELHAENTRTAKDVITVECKKFSFERIITETQSLIFKPNEEKTLSVFIPDQVKQFDIEVIAPSDLTGKYNVSTTKTYNNDKMGWDVDIRFKSNLTDNDIKTYTLVFKDNQTAQEKLLNVTLITKNSFASNIENDLLDEYQFENNIDKKLFIPLTPLFDSVTNAYFDFDVSPSKVKAKIIQEGNEFYLYAENSSDFMEAKEEELKLRVANEETAAIFKIKLKSN